MELRSPSVCLSVTILFSIFHLCNLTINLTVLCFVFQTTTDSSRECANSSSASNASKSSSMFRSVACSVLLIKYRRC
jgi:hypothetical protein